jgi:hypothetical protein
MSEFLIHPVYHPHGLDLQVVLIGSFLIIVLAIVLAIGLGCWCRRRR